MSNLRKLQQACELGLLEQAQLLAVGLDLTNMVGEGGYTRYPRTIYSYCATVELIQYVESLGVVPTYYDIINLGTNENSIDLFEYLLPRYDFASMDKKEDYLKGFNEAQALMPDNPVLFVVLKSALKYQRKAYIDKYIDAFKRIDWLADFVIEGAFGDAREPLMEGIALRYIKEGGYYGATFEKGMQENTKAWLNTLLEEYGIYDFRIFPTLLLYRATDLVEKYIQRDPQALMNERNLLSLMMYHTNGEDYKYKDYSKHKELYVFAYEEAERNKILSLLLRYGYNFIEREPEHFSQLLTGKIVLKEKRNALVHFDKTPFWQFLEQIPNTKKHSLFHIEMTWQELERLGQLGYFEKKEEALYELLNNFKKDGYAYNDYDEVDGVTSNEYKALALIKQGVTLSADQHVKLLLANTEYNDAAVRPESRVNYSLVLKVLCEKLANQATLECLLVSLKSLDSYRVKEFFQNYVEIKKPLLEKIQSEILAVESISLCYVNNYLRSEAEIFNYLESKKDVYLDSEATDNAQRTKIYLGDYWAFGHQLLCSKNFEGFKGVIRFVDKYGLKYASGGANYINVLKNIMAQNAPKEVVDFIVNEITLYSPTGAMEQSFLDNLIKYELFALIEKMREAGVDVDIKDKYGKTPLHYACEAHSIHNVQLYLKAGLSVTMLDRYGKTPIDCFLKIKPDASNTELLVLFESLLKTCVHQGGYIQKDAWINAIKAKKFAPYHRLIEDVANNALLSTTVGFNEDSERAEDESLVEVVIYRTEKTIHYHRYSSVIQVPKKDLVLDADQLARDYAPDWEYENDWVSDESITYEVIPPK